MSDGSVLVRNASQVVTCQGDGPADLGLIDRGAVLIRGGKVWWLGPEADLPGGTPDVEELDAAGGCVLPGFVDAHTHLVFAGDRAAEHQARLAGDRYQTGGIMTTVAATRAASTEALVAETEARAWSALMSGTTTLEAKSGYGLETEAERRQLEVLATVGERTPLRIVPTFLGAHLLPEPGYLDLLIEEMLPACAPLAEGCDAFCDLGALSVAEARKALEAGMAHGLVPRLHAEELAHTGGAALAAELGCASADHLVHANDDDARALANASVVAVLLPATSFCLRSSYAPARRFLERGVTIALATDCNPGTSYTTSMPFVVALACSELRLSAEEAVRAATAGGAAALRRPDLGRLEVGNPGDLVVLAGESYVDLAYHPGMDRIGAVVAGGKIVRA
ncbi:MAG TPA: imidazolonepropionase [Acidimicrobiia bacterium]|nr:imidazolonepropionase [Acidimicrobiia bacterium]